MNFITGSKDCQSGFWKRQVHSGGFRKCLTNAEVWITALCLSVILSGGKQVQCVQWQAASSACNWGFAHALLHRWQLWLSECWRNLGILPNLFRIAFFKRCSLGLTFKKKRRRRKCSALLGTLLMSLELPLSQVHMDVETACLCISHCHSHIHSFIAAEQMTEAGNGKRHHENRFDLQTPGNDVLKTPRPADHSLRAKA